MALWGDKYLVMMMIDSKLMSEEVNKGSSSKKIWQYKGCKEQRAMWNVTNLEAKSSGANRFQRRINYRGRKQRWAVAWSESAKKEWKKQISVSVQCLLGILSGLLTGSSQERNQTLGAVSPQLTQQLNAICLSPARVQSPPLITCLRADDRRCSSTTQGVHRLTRGRRSSRGSGYL